ncbi:UNVERIFIED_CONTAM: hypothetical protein Sradi_2663800 [Sesamum radiatum]|uniref:RNase H type-1 domain-containing protein n=1 Tax=Sesamum radiatum TaxID=300843 RepID=A0AAW2S5L8_SESRA
MSGIHLENKHELYLGLPAMAFRLKKALFVALKHRIWRRIHGWHEKNSFSSREALLAKQLLRHHSRPNSLVGRVLKAKYFPRSHLFAAQLGSRPSYTWRSMLVALPLLRSACRWCIGSGHLVRFWQDPWLPRGHSFRVITPPPHGLQLWVIDFARSYLSAFISQRTGMPAYSSWHPPTTECIKVKFDRAILDGGLALGFGVVAQNAVGMVLAWMSLRFDRGGPAKVAEAYAATKAVRLALRQHWHQVIIEG